MKSSLFIAALLTGIGVLPLNAESNAASNANNFNDNMDKFRTTKDPELRCSFFSNARFWAQRSMEDGGGTNLATIWNQTLPSSGCNATRLVLDPNSAAGATNPSPNQALQQLPSRIATPRSNGCLTMTDILEINYTKKISKRCAGNVFIDIRIAP